MATTIYEAIRSSLIALLKGRWPAFDVFGEGIDKTQEAGQTELEDYIYLDIIPSRNQPAGISRPFMPSFTRSQPISPANTSGHRSLSSSCLPSLEPAS